MANRLELLNKVAVLDRLVVRLQDELDSERAVGDELGELVDHEPTRAWRRKTPGGLLAWGISAATAFLAATLLALSLVPREAAPTSAAPTTAVAPAPAPAAPSAPSAAVVATGHDIDWPTHAIQPAPVEMSFLDEVEPRVPVSRTGRLAIDSYPSGTVRVDRRPMGPTPVLPWMLGAGTHTIELTLEGGRRVYHTARVATGQTTTAVFRDGGWARR